MMCWNQEKNQTTANNNDEHIFRRWDAINFKTITFFYLIAPFKRNLLQGKCKSNISMLTNAMQHGISRYQVSTLRTIKSFIAIRIAGRIFICAHVNNTWWNMYIILYNENSLFFFSLTIRYYCTAIAAIVYNSPFSWEIGNSCILSCKHNVLLR